MGLSEQIKKLGVELKNPTLVLFSKEISPNTLFNLRHVLGGMRVERLDVILQTPGGHIDPAFQITKLLRQATENLSIYIPLYAKSAGTLIALSASEIVMGDLSELGPLDTQIQETQKGDGPRFKSALNGFKALEQIQRHSMETWDVLVQVIAQKAGLTLEDAIRLASDYTGQTSGQLYSRMDPHRIGEYSRALEIGKEYGKEILKRFLKWPEAQANRTVQRLVESYPSHGYVLDSDELKKLGLNVKHMNYSDFASFEQLGLYFEELARTGSGKNNELIELINPVVEPEEKLKTQLAEKLAENEKSREPKKTLLKKNKNSDKVISVETPQKSST